MLIFLFIHTIENTANQNTGTPLCSTVLHPVLQVRCLKWHVVCSLKQNAGSSEQQQGILFQMNAVIPHKASQQAHARLVN